MRRPQLNPKIMKILKEKTKGEISERSIRNELSKIRREHPSLTLNAAAEIFAKKRGFSAVRYLEDKDRETLKGIKIEKIKISSLRPKQRKKIIEIAKYDTEDKLLKAHLDEINKTYTCTCYTATFVLCRKVLENILIYHILRKKYPEKKEEHREKYFDFDRRRFLDFERLLKNLRGGSSDFGPEKKLVERICELAGGFKETANEMTHSLYHIATKGEIDNKNFQYILDLIKELEENL